MSGYLFDEDIRRILEESDVVSVISQLENNDFGSDSDFNDETIEDIQQLVVETEVRTDMFFWRSEITISKQVW